MVEVTDALFMYKAGQKRGHHTGKATEGTDSGIGYMRNVWRKTQTWNSINICPTLLELMWQVNQGTLFLWLIHGCSWKQLHLFLFDQRYTSLSLMKDPFPS